MNENKLTEKKSEENSQTKKKGRWISYLPAFFIALITIALLLLIIIGTIFSGGDDQDAQVRALHSINFTGETAEFNDDYIYEPAVSEEPVFVAEQGFRWDSLASKIVVRVPEYRESVSINIGFGLFNYKVYSEAETNSNNYTIQAFDGDGALLETKTLTNVQNDSERQVVFQLEDVKRLTITFQEPITNIGEEVTSGYLYLKDFATCEIINYE